MCSAIAATGVPALVMAKGHVIDGIPEVGLICFRNLHCINGGTIGMMKRRKRVIDGYYFTGSFGCGWLCPGFHSHQAGRWVPQKEQGLGRCRQVSCLLIINDVFYWCPAKSSNYIIDSIKKWIYYTCWYLEFFRCENFFRNKWWNF